MIKRVMIGLIALGGVGLWWTDARAQCPGGVGSGGSCVTRVPLGRSLAGVTRSLDPGSSTFEFFGTVGPCKHKFNEGKLDCNCRIKGTAFCTPSSGPAPGFSASTFNNNTNDDDDDDDDDDDSGGGGGGSGLQQKPQILPKGLRVNNIGEPALTMPSPDGDPQEPGGSHWAVAELEPDSSCVTCPTGTKFLTFIADTIVMRSTFCPTGEGALCHTAIQVCKGGGGLSPTEIGSYDCKTVFECEEPNCPEHNPSGCIDICPRPH
jgi:hypothetical protein